MCLFGNPYDLPKQPTEIHERYPTPIMTCCYQSPYFGILNMIPQIRIFSFLHIDELDRKVIKKGMIDGDIVTFFVQNSPRDPGTIQIQASLTTRRSCQAKAPRGSH